MRPRPPIRNRRLAGFLTTGAPRDAAAFGGMGGRIYIFGLLLLALLFFLLVSKSKPPRALERVFQAPSMTDPEAAAKRREELQKYVGGAFLDPADGEGFKETAGYRRLIQKLIDQEVAADVVKDPPLFDRELAMRAPDVQRSEVVKVRGYVVKMWAHQLNTPVFQVTDVWRMVVVDKDGTDGVVVDVIAQPPFVEAKRDLVEITASFYRIVKYEVQASRAKDSFIEVPYLLARELEVVAEQPADDSPLSEPANIILLVALTAMVIFGLLRVVATRARRPTVQWRAPHLHSHVPPTSPESPN